MYRTLDAGEITATLHRLNARIVERFANAGLARVCADMILAHLRTHPAWR